ncbi:hypothetical protein HCU01_01260 [Halomonas cupida]|uniref:Uncharacterized protein n=1 Tax=Halomonas cupida TaxID=44933 RepID=A0A1M7B1P9_9GAMM|nr:hypothetical protein [Halomonas cupida]GEN22177.1 hypothetical protein HCU01_01260 [Halomonas cupida]SHL48817.1 hypothetical protein SAMN05660971_00723 [Halomonas cupida]
MSAPDADNDTGFSFDRFEAVPANIRRRIHQEREVIADAMSQVLRPHLERISQLEKRLDAMPEPTPPTLKGLDSAGLGRLATLEHRFAELERRGVEYCGVWRADKSYRIGQMVTCRGSGWVAREPCDAGEKPGTEGSGWTLAIKSGRDAKPCRCNRGGNTHE